ncbi:MAG: ribosome-associated translation inhibitor RaiA [Phycisphaerales bacterium]|nr:ribosome-associated translation inhibitor RaiA [Phycisphaerales bacterium]
MLITISAKHMELTEAITKYVMTKVGKLPKFFNGLQQLAVTIERAPHGYHVEIRSDVERHQDFVCNYQHNNLYACVDLAVDRGARQLADYKDRIRHHHRS